VVDGYVIETLTAAREYLRHKHGGRCAVEEERRRGRVIAWRLTRRGELLARYGLKDVGGTFVLELGGSGVGKTSAAEGLAVAAQRRRPAAALNLIHSVISQWNNEDGISDYVGQIGVGGLPVDPSGIGVDIIHIVQQPTQPKYPANHP
jgi:hypothetical protein